jgi:serine kinase of HPr protein (carbohydrate metabolism regulator)
MLRNQIAERLLTTMTSENAQQMIHATAVAINNQGIIIVGPSGSGKSDLAIRLIDRGARLVSDDQVLTSRQEDFVILNAPASIAGKIELYSVGIFDIPFVSDVRLDMIVQLTDDAERYPMDVQLELLLGMHISSIKLDGRTSSAPIKVEMALQKITNSGKSS